ncbi:hypothetical protein JCM1841_002099 [Sporobolomyces salmonicolor]
MASRARPPLAGLHTLPPELVAYILSLAAAAPSSSASDDPVFRRRRRRTLNSLSLVCSAWRPIAQRLLLDDGAVQLYFEPALARLSALVLGVQEQQIARWIRSLHVTLWGESQPDELVQLLTLSEGLEELVLEHVDRVRLDQVATGARLESFSARQCTFVAPCPPESSPSLDPAPTIYPSLRSLDLHLCSFRRDSLPSHTASFPALQHLLLFTGAQDQSISTVERFLHAAAPRVRSLSLDQTAWDSLLPPEEPGGGGYEEQDEEERGSQRPSPSLAALVPHLRTYGLYWDAAHRTLVGARLLTASSRDAPPPPYVHLSLYPSALDDLLGAFSALFPSPSPGAPSPSAAAAHASWRAVEHLRLEQTFRHLALDDQAAHLGADHAVHADEHENEGADEHEGEGEGEDKDADTRLLRRFTAPCADAGVPWTVDGAEQRGTQDRAFATSWWRFVRAVERGRVGDDESAPRARRPS